jgi:hypothetical protein
MGKLQLSFRRADSHHLIDTYATEMWKRALLQKGERHCPSAVAFMVAGGRI